MSRKRKNHQKFAQKLNNPQTIIHKLKKRLFDDEEPWLDQHYLVSLKEKLHVQIKKL